MFTLSTTNNTDTINRVQWKLSCSALFVAEKPITIKNFGETKYADYSIQRLTYYNAYRWNVIATEIERKKKAIRKAVKLKEFNETWN